MKIIKIAIMLLALTVASTSIFADDVEPIIKNNVTVIKGATADQCPSSYKTEGGLDQETVEDGAGMQTDTTSPGVTSCSDCAIQNGDCVCKTCYTNFDE